MEKGSAALSRGGGEFSRGAEISRGKSQEWLGLPSFEAGQSCGLLVTLCYSWFCLKKFPENG